MREIFDTHSRSEAFRTALMPDTRPGGFPPANSRFYRICTDLLRHRDARSVFWMQGLRLGPPGGEHLRAGYPDDSAMGWVSSRATGLNEGLGLGPNWAGTLAH